MDLTKIERIRECLRRLEPDAVINAAAFTQVDRAEREVDLCFQVNADAVVTLRDSCRELDIPLVQVSTDYIFGADADRDTPYKETDRPGPLNVYGASKLAGEHAARDWHKHFVVRTCGLYSAGDNGPQRGRNFVDTMLVLGRDLTKLRIVNDQMCTPSYVPHVAHALIRILHAAPYGTYHVTNAGSASWYSVARELFRQAGMQFAITPITSDAYGSPARRPAYSVLDNRKFHALNLGAIPDWKDGLRDYLRHLQQTRPAVRKAA